MRKQHISGFLLTLVFFWNGARLGVVGAQETSRAEIVAEVSTFTNRWGDPGRLRRPLVGLASRPEAQELIARALRSEPDPSTLHEDFVVHYNQHGLLDITLVRETLGAYPSLSLEHHLFDLRDGHELHGGDLIEPARAAELIARLERMRARAARRHFASRSDCRDAEAMTAHVHADATTLDSLRIDERGVTFVLPDALPHALRACEPPLELRLTRREAARFVRTGSVLSRALRR